MLTLLLLFQYQFYKIKLVRFGFMAENKITFVPFYLKIINANTFFFYRHQCLKAKAVCHYWTSRLLALEQWTLLDWQLVFQATEMICFCSGLQYVSAMKTVRSHSHFLQVNSSVILLKINCAKVCGNCVVTTIATIRDVFGGGGMRLAARRFDSQFSSGEMTNSGISTPYFLASCTIYAKPCWLCL